MLVKCSEPDGHLGKEISFDLIRDVLGFDWLQMR